MKPARYENVEDYLRDVQTDQVITWGTVHDEADYMVLKTKDDLHEAILKRMQEVASIKDVINKLGMPYLNFPFDIEWDDKDGTWLPNKAMEASYYPRTKEEHYYKEEFQKANDEIRKLPKTDKKQYEYYELDLSNESDDVISKWLERVSLAKDGDTKIVIIIKNKKLKYKRPINIETM